MEKKERDSRKLSLSKDLLLFPVVGHDDAAVGIGTGGISGNTGGVLQSGVDHMALIGVHGLQSHAAAVLDHLAGNLAGQMLQALLTLFTVALGIQLDAGAAAGAVDRVAGELLDCIQSFTAAADDSTDLIAFQNDLIAALLRQVHLDLSLGVHLLEQTGQEGCLSVPGKAGQVTRPNYVKVTALDVDMKSFTLEGEGLLARAICHELDHLDGHLYVEKVEGDLFDVNYSNVED